MIMGHTTLISPQHRPGGHCGNSVILQGVINVTLCYINLHSKISNNRFISNILADVKIKYLFIVQVGRHIPLNIGCLVMKLLWSF